MATTKWHSDCFIMPGGSSTHGTRNRQQEYKSRKRRNVEVLEAFCGRKHTVKAGYKVSGTMDCKTCIKAEAVSRQKGKK